MIIPTRSLDLVNPATFHRGLVVYLRLTDSCQLNCDHCFTEGNTAPLNFLDVDKTIDFFRRLALFAETSPYTRILLHGGEPFLAPTELIFKLHENIRRFHNLSWSVQTNLTFSMTPSILKVIKTVCHSNIGTSWDKDIRWKTARQKSLWQDNVRLLISEGVEITALITMDKSVIETPPSEIIEELIDLGIQYVSFERLTSYGNATKNEGIRPSNQQVNDYLLNMWKVTEEKGYNQKIHNTYLHDIAKAFISRRGTGVNCRDCEVKILTIRADGVVSGCPDSANFLSYGTIDDDVATIINSRMRRKRIAHEAARHDECFSCPAFFVCSGGCHQVEWDTSACGAPKSLYLHFLKNPNHEFIGKMAE